MSITTVSFSNPAYISLKNSQLLVELPEEKEKIVLVMDTLNALILEHPQITITSSALSKCMEAGICIFTMDKYHLPNGIMHSYLSHARTSSIIDKQINMKETLKANLWQKIISQKIYNQGEVLNIYNKDKGLELQNMSKHVAKGDSTFLEGGAAKVYFYHLFGKNFTRTQDNKINAMLNYGYSIIRGNIARTISVKGLLGSLGIFHKNGFNNFNLADDIIEPFRPILDNHVQKYLVENQGVLNEKDLTPEDKKYLLDVLNSDCLTNKGITTILTAITLFCDSFINALEQNNAKLLNQIKIK